MAKKLTKKLCAVTGAWLWPVTIKVLSIYLLVQVGVFAKLDEIAPRQSWVHKNRKDKQTDGWTDGSNLNA